MILVEAQIHAQGVDVNETRLNFRLDLVLLCGNVLVEVIIRLIAHLTVVVVVQRPRLWDVRQVLPEHAFRH